MDNETVSQISRGLMVLVGIGVGMWQGGRGPDFLPYLLIRIDDTSSDIDFLTKKMYVAPEPALTLFFIDGIVDYPSVCSKIPPGLCGRPASRISAAKFSVFRSSRLWPIHRKGTNLTSTVLWYLSHFLFRRALTNRSIGVQLVQRPIS